MEQRFAEWSRSSPLAQINIVSTATHTQSPTWVNFARRASWSAAAGAFQKLADVAGGHGFGRGIQPSIATRHRGPFRAQPNLV